MYYNYYHYYYYYYYHSPRAAAEDARAEVLHQLPNGVRTNGCFHRSAINYHNNAIIMPYLWHNHGILRHFCKNPVCPDPSS